MLKRLRSVVPLSGPAIALWGWRHRDEVIEWAGFGTRAARKLAAGDRTDVATEARVRAALNRDRRTRHAPGLRLEVNDGVLVMAGVVDPGVRDVARRVAGAVKGVERIEADALDELPSTRSAS